MNAYTNAVDWLKGICYEKSIPIEARSGLVGEIIDGKQIMTVDRAIPAGAITYDIQQTKLKIRFWHWNPLYNEEAVSFEKLFNPTPEIEAEFDAELRSAVDRLIANP